MRFLLDTQIVIWARIAPQRLTPRARELLVDPGNSLAYSVVSLWEAVIKTSRGKPDFAVDARLLRSRLLEDGLAELAVTAEHVLRVGALEPIHGDPFDRLLLAQARVEGMLLLTADAGLGRYGIGVAVV